MTRSLQRSSSRSSPLSWMELGCGLLLLGIAFSALGSPAIGSWTSVAGAVLAVVGLHKFGRLGPDPPMKFGNKNRKKKARRAKEQGGKTA